MALDELLEWAGTRYPWQQDALKRIALQSEITEDDLSELRAQIEQSAGLRAKGSPVACRLIGDHLAAAADDAPATVLASLGPVENVDRLEPGQSSLRFAVNGVTLIYGANGCGKSGYCRIAKQLCRSLSPGKLRGNVFLDAPARPPPLRVAFRWQRRGEVGADLGNRPASAAGTRAHLRLRQRHGPRLCRSGAENRVSSLRTRHHEQARRYLPDA